jgi:oxygen-independent coproporphyrinogen-3 oxidase
LNIYLSISKEPWGEYFQNFLRAIFLGSSVNLISEKDLQGKEGFFLELDIGQSENFDVRIRTIYQGQENFFRYVFSDAYLQRYSSFSAESDCLKAAKVALIKVLRQCTGREFPWGILVGVRPTKIVHDMLDRNLPDGLIAEILQENYLLKEEKSQLLQDIAKLQRNFFQPVNVASLYIGIPFCPTRCLYCTFPSYSIERWANRRQFFIEALRKEIRETGKVFREKNLLLESFYMGGGTPTSLNIEELKSVLNEVHRSFPMDMCREITVEAGRPDTITFEKLHLLKEWGVNRISINPQTMKEETLKLIGRKHDREDVFRAFSMAKRIGIASINTDVIIGLPRETPEDVNRTLEELIGLHPQSITIHTLAIKRASALNRQLGEISLPEAEETVAMLQKAKGKCRDAGMRPYYLYRQKHMLADLENVGYALPGFESVYNIQMMEDRQTILGLGPGAGTKILGQGVLHRMDNPKDPNYYMQNLDKLVRKKTELMSLLTGDEG